MCRFRKIALGLVFCTLGVTPGLAADGTPAPTRSPDDLAYLQGVSAVTDAMITKYSGLPKKPIRFSTNMQFASGRAIRKVPAHVLIAYADAVKEAGANCIDFNPTIASLRDPAALAKYDVLIAHIRAIGLQIAVNPVWDSPDDNALTTFAQYQDAAVKGEAFFAARYKPDYVAVVHEPTSMDARRTRGFTEHATVDQWRDFVSAVAKAVKAASPTTRVGAGAFNGDGREFSAFFVTSRPPTVFQEQLYYRAFVDTPELDFVTVDFYFPDPKGLAYMDQMVNLAHNAKKPVYIEETWRPHDLPSHMTVSVPERPRLGEAMFEPVDIQWMKAVSLYAATQGSDAVTFFYSVTFFTHTDSSSADSATSAYYNKGKTAIYYEKVRQALMKGERTDTFRAYRELAKEFGVH